MRSTAPPCAVVLTAPSGAGKTTIARRVLAALPHLRFAVSATTRPARPGERDGVDYHFVSADCFRRYIETGALVEYQEVYPGRFYGTLRSELERSSRAAPVVLDIDVKGAMNIKDHLGPNALTLFIHPPSLEHLGERLRARGTESPEALRERLSKAAQELTYAPRCDHIVYNADLERAVQETLDHIRTFLRTPDAPNADPAAGMRSP